MLINRELAFALFGAAALSLAACGGGKDLGVTKITTEFEPVEGCFAQAEKGGLTAQEIKACKEPVPRQMTLTDGKDKKTIAWAVNVAKGTATYDAADVSATDPAKVRAKIEKALSKQQVQAIESAFPGGITGLVQKVLSSGAL